MKTPFLVVFCIVAVGLAAPLAASELTNHFPTDDGFTVCLPEGWKPFPKATVVEFGKRMQKGLPEVVPCTYGFHQADNGASVFICVDRSRRMSEEEIRLNHDKMSAGLQKGMDKARSKVPTIASSDLRDARYDPSDHSFCATMRMDVTDGPALYGVVGVRLTEYGAVHVDCYCRASQAERYKPLFEQVIRSIEFDEASRYKVHPAYQSVLEPVLQNGVLLFVCAGVGLMLRFAGRALWRLACGGTGQASPSTAPAVCSAAAPVTWRAVLGRTLVILSILLAAAVCVDLVEHSGASAAGTALPANWAGVVVAGGVFWVAGLLAPGLYLCRTARRKAVEAAALTGVEPAASPLVEPASWQVQDATAEQVMTPGGTPGPNVPGRMAVEGHALPRCRHDHGHACGVGCRAVERTEPSLAPIEQ